MPDGLPNVRMVLLKEIEAGEGGGAFVFYTNYGSAKGQEITASGKAAFRAALEKPAPSDPGAGHCHRTRRRAAGGCLFRQPQSLKSRLGAWASHQSQPPKLARGADGAGCQESR
jgi:pyridoxamine 5'-phosphate oxidase